MVDCFACLSLEHFVCLTKSQANRVQLYRRLNWIDLSDLPVYQVLSLTWLSLNESGLHLNLEVLVHQLVCYFFNYGDFYTSI